MTPERATQLIDRYFDGATTLEEEAELKVYFRESEVDPALTVYAPLFHYWEREAGLQAPPPAPVARTRRLPTALLAVAAALLLLLVAHTVHRYEQPRLSNFPVAERQPVDWSRHEITDEKEALRFLKTVFKSTSQQLTQAPTMTLRELRQVERILD